MAELENEGDVIDFEFGRVAGDTGATKSGFDRIHCGEQKRDFENDRKPTVTQITTGYYKQL